MDAQTKIIRASHMIDMNDIIREGNPTLRAVAEDVTFPLSGRFRDLHPLEYVRAGRTKKRSGLY